MLLAVSSRILCWAQLLLRTTQLQADPSDATRQACADLAVAVPELVSGPAVAAYGAERGHYWSSLLRDAEPTCIVRPRTAEDVAAAVRVLNRYPDVQFAVKSGGHTPNPRHSSVHDGVLISMNDVRGVYYDSDTQLAHVKPGGTWNEAIGALEKEGVMILGGRMGLVGVGGLLSQGGVSYLAAEHGLAADVRASA